MEGAFAYIVQRKIVLGVLGVGSKGCSRTEACHLPQLSLESHRQAATEFEFGLSRVWLLQSSALGETVHWHDHCDTLKNPFIDPEVHHITYAPQCAGRLVLMASQVYVRMTLMFENRLSHDAALSSLNLFEVYPTFFRDVDS